MKLSLLLVSALVILPFSAGDLLAQNEGGGGMPAPRSTNTTPTVKRRTPTPVKRSTTTTKRTVAPKPKADPTAKLDKIWIDYDVTEEGRFGMRVHAKLTVYDMKGVDGYVAFFFQRKNGDLLKTTNSAYSSKSGQVAVYFSLKPGYTAAVYEDADAFIPYAELKLGNGSYNLQIDADLLYKDGTLIQHLDFHDFVYKKGL